jgi:4-hydroxybenzoate polyprenyltransferase
LIAAAGYVINDIFDQDTDAINKPNKSDCWKSITKAIHTIITGLNITEFNIGFYLSM